MTSALTPLPARAPAPARTTAAAAGFTLVELLIALFISLVLLAAVFVLLSSSFTRYLVERERIDVQQNTRFATDAIARVIRSAGNNPLSLEIARFTTGPGCPPVCPPGPPLPPPGCPPACSGAWSTAAFAAFETNPLYHADQEDNLRVRSDFNPADGVLDDPMEDIVIYVSGDTLYYRDMGRGASDEPQFHSIESVTFELLDANGAPTAVADSVRQVRMTISGRSLQPHPKTGVYYRTGYSNTVAPRPLSL